MPLPNSHLRQVSTGNATAGQGVRDESRPETCSNLSKSLNASRVQLKRICSLSIHDDPRNDAFVNLDRFQSDNIKIGDLVQIKAMNGAANTSVDGSGSHLHSQGRSGQSCTDNELHASTANSRGSGQKPKHDHPELTSDLSQRFIFAVKDMSFEQKTKQPGCQVCYFSLTIPRSFC